MCVAHPVPKWSAVIGLDCSCASRVSALSAPAEGSSGLAIPWVRRSCMFTASTCRRERAGAVESPIRLPLPPPGALSRPRALPAFAPGIQSSVPVTKRTCSLKVPPQVSARVLPHSSLINSYHIPPPLC